MQLRLVINPKPIDSTSGVNYLYAFTTFFPEIRKSTDNSVTFQVGKMDLWNVSFLY